MSFFDAPRPPEPPPERHKRPVWAGPPDGVVPALSHQRAVLIATDTAVMTADQFRVYPNGVAFTLSLSTRESHHGTHHGMHGPPFQVHHHPGAKTIDDDFLRFGIQFGDGTKWTNAHDRFPAPDEDPVGPIVMSRGGGGGDNSWEMRYWMWPLPPAGPVSFVTSWPSEDVVETVVELDADEWRGLADSAQVLWPSSE